MPVPIQPCRPQDTDVIINCAAHTNVDKCEIQEDLAYKINAIGARNLSIAATEINAKLIQVSTDYVFSGDASEPISSGKKNFYNDCIYSSKAASHGFIR